jgi:hypothetical protein
VAAMTVQSIGYGTLLAPAAVTTSDTVQTDGDARGMILEVINGSGGSINVTVTDPGTTPAGSAAAGGGVVQAVAAATRRHFRLLPSYANTSGIITVTYSSATSVTYNLWRS